VKKPNPRIYHLALERLKVKPQDCLYVGDGSNRELTGARKVGMHPVLIRTSTEENCSFDEDDWDGTAVSSLSEVLDLIE